MRVRMTDWLTFGSVYSALSAAAAPQNEDTPGQTSLGNPAFIQLVHLLASRTVHARIAGVQTHDRFARFRGRRHHGDDLLERHLRAVVYLHPSFYSPKAPD